MPEPVLAPGPLRIRRTRNETPMSTHKYSRRDVVWLSAAAGLGLSLPAGDCRAEFTFSPPQPKPDEDWALAVGVQDYPEFNTAPAEQLKGPVNDAQVFFDWVTAPKPLGGGVPKANARLVVQPCSSAGPAKTPCPTLHHIEDALEQYWNVAKINDARKLGQRVGRRLYLYFAGHGIEPLLVGPALLTADAAHGALVRHVLGKSYAEWFFKAAYFDEVLLFMDCCRDNRWTTPACRLLWDPKFGNSAKCKFFHAFGTRWDRTSRERAFNGTIRGIFTTALMEGLNGAASDPISNQITAASLAAFLTYGMDEFLGPELARLAAEDGQGIEINHQPQKGDQFVIAESVPPKLHLVNVRFALLPNGPVRITLTAVQAGTVVEKDYYNETPCANAIQLRLPRGVYAVRVAGQAETRSFQVPKTADIAL